MNRISLRWLILVPLLVTITTGFAIFAIYIDQSDRSTRLAEIDRELTRAERVDLARPATGPSNGITPTTPDPTATDSTTGVDPPVQLTLSPSGDVTVAQGGGNPFPRDTLAALASASEPTTAEIGDYRVLVSPQSDGQVRVTALSLEGYHATTDALRRTLILGGLIIAVLESAMAWWLAGRLVRPLATMAGTANQIADGALDTEVQHAGGSREIADLSTDIERMVARLRAALDERERSEVAATQARDDMQRFLADVSHEIRTPLTALKGYSDLYDKGMLADPGALDRAMSRVGSESVRLHRMVNAMLELARDGETRPQVEVDVDVPQIVRAVVDDLRAAHPERRIDVQTGHAVDATLAGDPARIHQAVLNLGANACTHTPAATPITIAVESTTTALAVSVIDHGAGIDEAEQTRIFLPFYRIDPSRVRNGHGGAGLGLALAQQIAQEHHGSISIHPTTGGGATFILRLPRVGRNSRHLDLEP
ncbi:MAG: HAMP domain-containing sensor histidine kinase [Nocardioidaceae bacterium]